MHTAGKIFQRKGSNKNVSHLTQSLYTIWVKLHHNKQDDFAFTSHSSQTPTDQPNNHDSTLDNEGSTSTTMSVMPILKADITNIAGNPNFIYLIKHSLHEWTLFCSGKKRKRCGVCDGCTSDDCKKCRFCLDMPKYGGKGTMKKCCSRRLCLRLGSKPMVSAKGICTPTRQKIMCTPTKEMGKFSSDSIHVMFDTAILHL